MKKKILIILISLFLVYNLLDPKEIFAGSHSCRFVPQTGCNVSSTSCASNEVPNYTYCQGFSTQQTCNSAPSTSCLIDPATTACSGVCRTTACFPNEQIGPGTCSGSASRCCIPPPNAPPGGGPSNGSGSTSKGIDPTCEGGTGIETAIGCIRVLDKDQNVFLGDILGWAVGVGGGIAFLLIVYAGFMIMSSAGSPDRLKAGQELMTSAISGIVLLVLSIFVLRVIGVDILKIPGFGGEKTQKIQEGADIIPVI